MSPSANNNLVSICILLIGGGFVEEALGSSLETEISNKTFKNCSRSADCKTV